MQDIAMELQDVPNFLENPKVKCLMFTIIWKILKHLYTHKTLKYYISKQNTFSGHIGPADY